MKVVEYFFLPNLCMLSGMKTRDILRLVIEYSADPVSLPGRYLDPHPFVFSGHGLKRSFHFEVFTGLKPGRKRLL